MFKEKVLGIPMWQWAVALLFLATFFGYALRGIEVEDKKTVVLDAQELIDEVIPIEGYEIPARWGSLGKQLIDGGVIDEDQFSELYASGGGLEDRELALLYGEDNGNLVIDRTNAHVLLNLLWALGLANENPVLIQGPMMDPNYGGYEGFASTGGWTLSVGPISDHYAKHNLIELNSDQQSAVEEVAKNIYRPCCNNSTYFPDCNHGMAMLGLLELMASQGATVQEMYEAALAVNAYWFPDTYITIGAYMDKKGVAWEDVDPKEILGFDFSSGSGFSRILQEIDPVDTGGAGSCSV